MYTQSGGGWWSSSVCSAQSPALWLFIMTEARGEVVEIIVVCDEGGLLRCV